MQVRARGARIGAQTHREGPWVLATVPPPNICCVNGEKGPLLQRAEGFWTFCNKKAGKFLLLLFCPRSPALMQAEGGFLSRRPIALARHSR